MKSSSYVPKAGNGEKVSFTTTDGETVTVFKTFFSSISRNGTDNATVTLIDHAEYKVADFVAETLIQELFKS